LIVYIAARQWDGRTNAWSDGVVLEFFTSFLFKQKRKGTRTTIELSKKIGGIHDKKNNSICNQ